MNADPSESERVALFAHLTDSIRPGSKSARHAMQYAVDFDNLDMVKALVQAGKHDLQQNYADMQGEPLIHCGDNPELTEYLRRMGFARCNDAGCRTCQPTQEPTDH